MKEHYKLIGKYLHEVGEEMDKLDWLGCYPVINSNGRIMDIKESDSAAEELIVFNNDFLATENDGIEYCESQNIKCYYDKR